VRIASGLHRPYIVIKRISL